MLTQDELKEMLHYDQDTGALTWRPRVNVHASWNRKYAGKPVGRVNDKGYRWTAINGRNYSCHRLAWLYVFGRWPDLDLDHINGNPADNRLCNLREATESENMANARLPKNNKSGFKGVWWYARTKRWKAHIRKDGHLYHLGYFTNIEDARNAYARAAVQLHGEFARAT